MREAPHTPGSHGTMIAITRTPRRTVLARATAPIPADPPAPGPADPPAPGPADPPLQVPADPPATIPGRPQAASRPPLPATPRIRTPEPNRSRSSGPQAPTSAPAPSMASRPSPCEAHTQRSTRMTPSSGGHARVRSAAPAVAPAANSPPIAPGHMGSRRHEADRHGGRGAPAPARDSAAGLRRGRQAGRDEL